MKIFLDTADIAAIKKWSEAGLIDGVTTNPTHLSKAGGDPTKVVREICALLKPGLVSVEVTEKKPDKVYAQAKEIAKIADNVLVKVPCHIDYYPIIKKLVKDGVALNITLLFTLVQALFMCKLRVAYISPFIGRRDDIDAAGMDVVTEIRDMMDMHNFTDTKLLAASIRGVRKFHQAILAGADVVTLPVAILEKAVSHPLTDKGIAKFDADWQKLGVKQFP